MFVDPKEDIKNNNIEMGGTGALGHAPGSTYKWQPIIGDCRVKNSVLGRNGGALALPGTLT